MRAIHEVEREETANAMLRHNFYADGNAGALSARNRADIRGGCGKPIVVAVAEGLVVRGDAVLFDAGTQLGAGKAEEPRSLGLVLPRLGEGIQDHLAFGGVELPA